VAAALELVGDVPIVLDPVMVAESGARLLDEEAVQALRDELVPRATVVTPNLAEAAALTGRDASDDPEEPRPRGARARAEGRGGHGRPSRAGHRYVL